MAAGARKLKELNLEKQYKMNKEMLDLLIYSLDFELNTEEALRLEKALTASEELRLEKEQLLKARQFVQAFKLEADSTFVNKVMAQIKEAPVPVFTKAIIQLFPKVAAACVLLFFITLIGIYVTEGSLSADAIIGIDDISVEEAFSLIEI